MPFFFFNYSCLIAYLTAQISVSSGLLGVPVESPRRCSNGQAVQKLLIVVINNNEVSIKPSRQKVVLS